MFGEVAFFRHGVGEVFSLSLRGCCTAYVRVWCSPSSSSHFPTWLASLLSVKTDQHSHLLYTQPITTHSCHKPNGSPLTAATYPTDHHSQLLYTQRIITHTCHTPNRSPLTATIHPTDHHSQLPYTQPITAHSFYTPNRSPLTAAIHPTDHHSQLLYTQPITTHSCHTPNRSPLTATIHPTDYHSQLHTPNRSPLTAAIHPTDHHSHLPYTQPITTHSCYTHPSTSSLRFIWPAWLLKKEAVGCPETPLNNYQYTTRENTEERRPQLFYTRCDWRIYFLPSSSSSSSSSPPCSWRFRRISFSLIL